MARSADTAMNEAGIGAPRRPAYRIIRRALAGGFAVVALAAFGAVLIYAYNKSQEHSAGAAPVVLKPQAGAYKVRPDSPGGMAVPDRDKEVYETIAAGPAEKKVEHLMPGREEPIAPPKPKTKTKTKTIVHAEPSVSAPAEPAKAPPAAPSKEVDKTSTGANYRVQIASLRSRPAVEEAWKALLGKHRDLLSGLDMSVERADLGPSKGVYFRMRAGPFEDRASARKLCSELTSRKVGCIVVGR